MTERADTFDRALNDLARLEVTLAGARLERAHRRPARRAAVDHVTWEEGDDR